MERRGSISVLGVPPPDAGVQERLTAYQNTRNSAFAGFLHDDGLLITTRFADSAQVHHVRTPLGQRRQMTFSKEPVKGCLPSPKGGVAPKGFILAGDVGGDEQVQANALARLTNPAPRLTNPAQPRVCPAARSCVAPRPGDVRRARPPRNCVTGAVQLFRLCDGPDAALHGRRQHEHRGVLVRRRQRRCVFQQRARRHAL